MKKYFIIQGITAAAIMLGTVNIASANIYPAVPINGSKCLSSTTVSITDAKTVATYLNLNQTEWSQLFSPANLYIYTIQKNIQNIGALPSYNSAMAIGLCLQPGYVTNVPSGIDTGPIFNQTRIGSYSSSGYFLATTSPYVPYPSIYNSSNHLFADGLNVRPPTVLSTTTLTTSYAVSVNYDKFASESAQNGYTSVYTTTGTKTVTIVVVQLPSGSTLSSNQVISNLSTLGYRPATLSEIYGLKMAQPAIVNSSLVALGTSLTGYGYPTGAGSGASGLGHSSGPFNTTTFKFAAVKK